jgi:hypothetical protein
LEFLTSLAARVISERRLAAGPDENERSIADGGRFLFLCRSLGCDTGG